MRAIQIVTAFLYIEIWYLKRVIVRLAAQRDCLDDARDCTSITSHLYLLTDSVFFVVRQNLCCNRLDFAFASERARQRDECPMPTESGQREKRMRMSMNCIIMMTTHITPSFRFSRNFPTAKQFKMFSCSSFPFASNFVPPTLCPDVCVQVCKDVKTKE